MMPHSVQCGRSKASSVKRMFSLDTVFAEHPDIFKKKSSVLMPMPIAGPRGSIQPRGRSQRPPKPNAAHKVKVMGCSKVGNAFTSLSRQSQNQTGFTMAGSPLMRDTSLAANPLTEQYAPNLQGMLLRYARLIVTGMSHRANYADGITRFLFVVGLPICCRRDES